MVNYNNSKIYKIESHLGDKVYIGSTTKEYLSQRMDAHRCGFKRWKNGKTHYLTAFIIFDEYGLENCKIILLEALICNTKDELHAREAHYIKTMNCINKNIPNRIAKQYKKDNKDKISEQGKTYRDDNKESLSEYKKKYYKDNKEKVKQYYADNKDKILERKKQYYEDNKDKISERMKKHYQETKANV